jgi:hypothetical protein
VPLAFFAVKIIFSHRFFKGERRTETVEAQTAGRKEFANAFQEF